MSEAVDFTDVDETRAPASMIFIGHVDAGKSTICGNIMYLTGMVDDRTIRAYQKEAQDKKMDSWWLAYVMDQNEEEKEKGKTVEVGRATMETPRIRYTIFDAPGHKNYVPNMIQGAACADFASLVISARKGEFEAGFEREGQTREHAQLAKSLGVTKLIIIVNKLDDCQWRPERYNEIKEKVDPFLAQCGYDINTDVFWIPIAGITGENIKFRKDVDWYKGPTLLELFD